MFKHKKTAAFLSVVLVLLTFFLPVFAEPELDNAEEQQDTARMIQTAGAVLIAAVLAFILFKNRALLFKSRSQMTGASDFIDENKAVDKIRLSDTEFDREVFRGFAGKVLVSVLDGLSKRNPAQLRLYESNELFALHEKQIRESIESRRRNHLDDLITVSAEIADYNEKNGTDTITVRAAASMLDYTTDDVSEGVLDGSRIAKRVRTYRLEFIRQHGVRSSDAGKPDICPACGKPTAVTFTGKCAECRTPLCDGSRGWVLNSMLKWGHET